MTVINTYLPITVPIPGPSNPQLKDTTILEPTVLENRVHFSLVYKKYTSCSRIDTE